MAANVRVDLGRGTISLWLPSMPTAEGDVLTVQQAQALRRQLATALAVISDGYSVEPSPGTISYRHAREVLPPEAPHCWRPGMRPVYDGEDVG